MFYSYNLENHIYVINCYLQISIGFRVSYFTLKWNVKRKKKWTYNDIIKRLLHFVTRPTTHCSLTHGNFFIQKKLKHCSQLDSSSWYGHFFYLFSEILAIISGQACGKKKIKKTW